MKISKMRIEEGQLSFEMTHEGARDLFATQTAILQLLLQERATLLAQNRLLFDLVAELRREDVSDVEARFENSQRDNFQQFHNDLKKILPLSEFDK